MAISRASPDTCILQPDYTKTLGDRFFSLANKAIPNPELRIILLPKFAGVMSLPGLKGRAHPELARFIRFRDKSVPISMAGPVMLAAGANKDGAHLPWFSALGFGGVTVGSVTRNTWAGNPHRPRMALIPEDRAVINNMGLNNPGIEAAAKAVDFMLGKCHKTKLALGISVAESPGLINWEKMVEDLLFSFRKAYKAADYIEINVSSPNTESVRIDWHKNFLKALLLEVMKIRRTLAPRKAVFVKLSPDMSRKSLEKTLDIVSEAEVTGLVLFNTFPTERMQFLNMKTDGSHLPNLIKNGISGGISGRALYQNTLPAVKFIKKQFPGLHVFASGGIDHGAKVIELLEAGADAVQCLSVLSYRWNAIKKINREVLAAMKQKQYKTIQHFDSFVTCK